MQNARQNDVEKPDYDPQENHRKNTGCKSFRDRIQRWGCCAQTCQDIRHEPGRDPFQDEETWAEGR